MDIKVTGTEEFAVLARRLKEIGDKDLRREFYAGINRSVKPLTQDVKNSTDDFVPSGFADELADTLKIRVSKRGGANPGVRLRATASTPSGTPRDLSSLNRGRLRHPLYGNRRFWFNQTVVSKFYDKPLEEGAPKVRRELVEGIRRIVAKIEASI